MKVTRPHRLCAAAVVSGSLLLASSPESRANLAAKSNPWLHWPG